MVVLSGAEEPSQVFWERLKVDECLLTQPKPPELARSIRHLVEKQGLDARHRELEDTIRIMDACQVLTRCLEFDQLYSELLELLLKVLGGSEGIAFFPRSTPAKGMKVVLRGFDEEDAERVTSILSAGQKKVASSVESGVSHRSERPLHETRRGAGFSLDSTWVMGLGHSTKDAGLVAISGGDLSFSELEKRRAEIIFRHAQMALENAAVYRSAQEHAFIDDVTGVYNIRYFMDICEKELRRSARYSVPLSLLFLDLDQFKRINEELGHVQGSQVLNRLCQFLKQHVRQVDTLARYGGDEFAILLVGTDHVEALAIAERIRVAVESDRVLLGEEASLELTLSIGVATCPDHGLERDAFIEAADRAMFQAKASGRNCVFSVNELS
jgi:diguanylate cyclase (GGDEF)-like protein